MTPCTFIYVLSGQAQLEPDWLNKLESDRYPEWISTRIGVWIYRIIL